MWKLESILDVSFAFVGLFLMLTLCQLEILAKKYFWWLMLGTGIGLCWEIPHSLIPNFIKVHDSAQSLQYFYPIAHAIWDGFILLFSAWIASLFTKVTSIYALFLMLAFGFFFEICVELIANGRFWTYNEDFAENPVVFYWQGQGYTLWPFLEWILAPIFFWLCLTP